MYPRAVADVIVSECADEAVVYELSTHRAHCLGPEAFAVFSGCDGRRSPAALAAHLSMSQPVVRRALDELHAAGLLQGRRRRVDLSRRRLVNKLALTAGLSIAAPMVWSIVAPSVAEAASVTCVACNAGTVGQCCDAGGRQAGTCRQLGRRFVCGGTSCGPGGNNTCR